MDNDLPSEPNDFAAATYADLAWKAKQRADRGEPGAMQEYLQLKQLAYAYSQRYELSHGKQP